MSTGEAKTPDALVRTEDGFVLSGFDDATPFRAAALTWNGREFGRVYTPRSNGDWARYIDKLDLDGDDPRFQCLTATTELDRSVVVYGKILEAAGLTEHAEHRALVGFPRPRRLPTLIWQNAGTPIALETIGVIVVLDEREIATPCEWCIRCRTLGELAAAHTGSWVYFIRAGKGPIKIGRSVNVGSRIATMQTGNAEELRVVARMPGGAAIESMLHARFAAARMRGEWFQPTPDLLALVAEIGGTS